MPEVFFMPLAFESLSHGQIAFGFFNIETDMLLLDIHFFFADDFSRAMMKLALEPGDRNSSVDLDAYTLLPSQIGNLMGSIHGVSFEGFIGKVYRRYPFPREESKFRQDPMGWRNRAVIEDMVRQYARIEPIDVTVYPARSAVDIGGYVFSRTVFNKLIDYVWEGGFPRWKDGVRPQYVLDMKAAVESSINPIFR